MNSPRADFGIATSADGFMHAFGGRTTGGATLKTIEGYRPSNGAWTIEPHSLPTPLSGFGTTECLTGAVYIVGGENGTTLRTTAIKAFPPFEPAHSVTYYVHQFDLPTINGNFAMNSNVPLQGVGLLSLGLLSSANFATYPAVSGQIVSGGSVTVQVPGLLILGVINGLSVTATNEDGSHPVVIGSVSSLIGLGGTVNIPITTPLKLRNKVLVLNISTILGLDLDLSGGAVSVTLNGLNGKPSNPQ